jgi:hypothetical protein
MSFGKTVKRVADIAYALWVPETSHTVPDLVLHG